MDSFEPLQAFRPFGIDIGASVEPAHDGGAMFPTAPRQFTNRPAEGDQNGGETSG